MKNQAQKFIVDSIMNAMANGETPFVKDFTKCDVFSGKQDYYINEPRNYATNRAYTGINRLLPAGYYLTFKQIVEMGAKLNKGSKAHMVIACFPYEMVTYEYVENDETITKTVTKKWFDENKPEYTKKTDWVKWSEPKYYNVYNINDCTGLKKLNWEDSLATSKEKVWINPNESDPLIDKIIDYQVNQKLQVKLIAKSGISSSYYDVENDKVVMKHYDEYKDMVDYYHQLFHELGHSTGAMHRLNRKTLTDTDGFGGENYSFEECAVEAAATIISDKLNILTNESLKESKDYIVGWYNRLKEFKREDTAKVLIQIFANADKIVNYLLSE